MVEIITREKGKAHFRIQIYDMVAKKSKLISLKNHKNMTLAELTEAVIKGVEKL